MDYLAAVCKLKKARLKYDIYKYCDEVESLERFFLGEDIMVYTKLNGAMLLEGLDRIAKEYKYDWPAIKKSRVGWLYLMAKKLKWEDIYKDFKKNYPKLYAKAMHWHPWDVCEILIYFENGVRRVYNYNLHEITKTWIDENYLK